MKIKKGDNVVVISGKDKGKKGKVLKVILSEDRIVVEGMNVKKKHQRPRKANQKGQIIEFSAPFHVSNVMLFDTKKNEPTRVGYRVVKGKKERFSKKSGTVI